MKALFLSLSLLSSIFWATAQASNKHAHGNAHLQIAVDGNKMEIHLESPGDSIVGFEHKAKTKGEKQKVMNARYVWEKEWHKLFAIPGGINCKAKETEFEVKTNKGGHNEFEMELLLECNGELAGKKMGINILQFYTAIEYLHTEVVPAKGQPTRAAVRSVGYEVKL